MTKATHGRMGLFEAYGSRGLRSMMMGEWRQQAAGTAHENSHLEPKIQREPTGNARSF